MTSIPPQSDWSPLASLHVRFAANVDALATRRPGLADLLRKLAPRNEYAARSTADGLQLGVETPTGIQPVPNVLPPSAAAQIAAKLCPAGVYPSPVLVTGEDLGWLWNALYRLPCHAPTAPGHRPPLFFLVRDLERLWLMLHVQEWAGFLADQRVRLFIGMDSFEQFRTSMTQDLTCPWPRASIVIDPSLWPTGTTIDGVLESARVNLTGRFKAIEQQLAANHFGQTAGTLAELYQSGRPMKVLGITSRYTTFLQYSMRDWLAAFGRLGHCTRLVIESADHEIAGPLAFAEACAEFKPDLIVVIDHFRKELGGLPQNVPVAMWVQDALPNLFSASGGAAQGPRDYSLGFGRLKMIREYNYPPDRYMSAIVGLNDERFAPSKLSDADRERFGAEVSFVSHASVPAEQIVQEEIARIGSPEASRLLSGVFDQLRAVYAAGGLVTEPIEIRRMIDRSLADAHLQIAPAQMQPLQDLFALRVNNALFRHQSLLWLAEMGVDLRLWGRGWEKHPRLARFARGIADNAAQLPFIYQASQINLQITPHGAVHQRTMEGLAAGGFFLIRECPGDLLEREFRAIGDWCRANDIKSDADLQHHAPPPILARIAAIASNLKQNPFELGEPLIQQIMASACDGYIRSAATVWEDDYDAVSYRSADELRAKVSGYLASPSERDRIAASMRRIVLDRFTYVATSCRLLKFMANDLLKQSRSLSAAAA